MKPLDAGHYWYFSPKLGLVPATVTRDMTRGRLMAQYMNERWPVESDIDGAVWVARVDPPDVEQDALNIKAGGTI